jgi:sodium-coupled monocarboxylate transporter 8/12
MVIIFINVILGLYYRLTGGKQKTSREYLLADGNMSVLPVAFSLMASFMSAVTLLGTTQVIMLRL